MENELIFGIFGVPEVFAALLQAELYTEDAAAEQRRSCAASSLVPFLPCSIPEHFRCFVEHQLIKEASTQNCSHESQCQGRDEFSVFRNLFSVTTAAQTTLILLEYAIFFPPAPICTTLHGINDPGRDASQPFSIPVAPFPTQLRLRQL